jgi:hypothetical protein
MSYPKKKIFQQILHRGGERHVEIFDTHLVMNLLRVPTSNLILNTVLRSIVLILLMVFGMGTTLYTAYWGAIVHDIVSLVLIRDLV